jgi:hypothetical protein
MNQGRMAMSNEKQPDKPATTPTQVPATTNQNQAQNPALGQKKVIPSTIAFTFDSVDSLSRPVSKPKE